MKHCLLPLVLLLAACDDPPPPPAQGNAGNPLLKMQGDTVKKVEDDLGNAVRQQRQAIDNIEKQ